MEFEKDFPELLALLGRELRRFLTEQLRLDAAAAEETARCAIEHVREYWGGQLLYIPTTHAVEVNRRHEEIWSKFQGDNVNQLATEYKCSTMTIYRIVKKMRALKRGLGSRTPGSS